MEIKGKQMREEKKWEQAKVKMRRKPIRGRRQEPRERDVRTREDER